MEEKRIAEIRNRVTALLDKGCLKNAIETLGEEIETLHDWTLRTRFTQMQESYGYLLEYLRNSTPDPGREQMYHALTGECYILNDIIAITRETEKSFSPYHAARKHYKNLSQAELLHTQLHENAANAEVARMLPQAEREKSLAAVAQKKEELLNHLFKAIWCSISWSKSDAEKISRIIADEELSQNDRALCVSAVTLSLLKCFEPAKALTLINAVYNDSVTISTRALVGVMLSLFTHDKRIKFHPELQAALQAVHDDARLLTRAGIVQIQLLRCRETKKIDRKMREEIIPAMLKNPHLNSEKMGIDILREIEEEEDKNPEWKEWVEKDEIKGKLEEMTKWQIEGADVYMSTFSQLKRYPFFNEIKNWLRPFDTTIPEIAEILPADTALGKTMLGAICASRFFCNSDKYSFCLTFKQVPQEQRDMLMQQLGGHEEIANAPDTTSEAPAEKEAEIQSNQYIQDLYRFFKLSPFAKEITDPFALSLNMLECKYSAMLVTEAHTLLQTFEYLLNKGYFAEAVAAGKIYEKQNSAGEQFYQEMGYCLQKEKDYHAALDYYTRADIVKPDTLWTMRHIAQCYRLVGEADKALSYYLPAEEIAPDDLSLQMQTGECLAILKRYDEAFARFFKVEYNKPGSIKAMRAIAWCSLLTGKAKQARDYYKKILEHKKASFNDYMNAAHVEWIQKENARAVELYRKAKEMCDNEELFYTNFDKDRTTLAELGADKTEITLLRDLIG